MMYCSNCGEQIDEKAVICVKCGVPVNNNMSKFQSINQVSVEPKQGHGAATASLVLGILGIIVVFITFIVAISFFVYNRNGNMYRSYYSQSVLDFPVKFFMCIMLTILPAIFSLIGLPLGCFCKKGGPKIAGIVLNAITIVICIVQVVLIMNA